MTVTLTREQWQGVRDWLASGPPIQFRHALDAHLNPPTDTEGESMTVRTGGKVKPTDAHMGSTVCTCSSEAVNLALARDEADQWIARLADIGDATRSRSEADPRIPGFMRKALKDDAAFLDQIVLWLSAALNPQQTPESSE